MQLPSLQSKDARNTKITPIFLLQNRCSLQSCVSTIAEAFSHQNCTEQARILICACMRFLSQENPPICSVLYRFCAARRAHVLHEKSRKGEASPLFPYTKCSNPYCIQLPIPFTAKRRGPRHSPRLSPSNPSPVQAPFAQLR